MFTTSELNSVSQTNTHLCITTIELSLINVVAFRENRVSTIGDSGRRWQRKNRVSCRQKIQVQEKCRSVPYNQYVDIQPGNRCESICVMHIYIYIGWRRARDITRREYQGCHQRGVFCARVARSTARQFSLAKGNETRGWRRRTVRGRLRDEEPSIVTALPGMHI